MTIVLMIVSILALPTNTLFAIFALIIVCEGHEQRVMRLHQNPYICCYSIGCFKVFTILLSIGGILGSIIYVVIAQKTIDLCLNDPYTYCNEAALNGVKIFRGFFIYVAVIQTLFVFLLVIYVSMYQSNYPQSPLVTNVVVQQHVTHVNQQPVGYNAAYQQPLVNNAAYAQP